MTIIPVRDALINHIIKTLEPHKFQRHEDTFESLGYMVHPGRRMVVNGQVFDEPPTHIPVVLRIELHGPGSISSPGCDESRFELMSFMASVGDEQLSEDVCIFYDDINEFNEYLNIFFNL